MWRDLLDTLRHDPFVWCCLYLISILSLITAGLRIKIWYLRRKLQRLYDEQGVPPEERISF